MSRLFAIFTAGALSVLNVATPAAMARIPDDETAEGSKPEEGRSPEILKRVLNHVQRKVERLREDATAAGVSGDASEASDIAREARRIHRRLEFMERRLPGGESVGQARDRSASGPRRRAEDHGPTDRPGLRDEAPARPSREEISANIEKRAATLSDRARDLEAAGEAQKASRLARAAQAMIDRAEKVRSGERLGREDFGQGARRNAEPGRVGRPGLPPIHPQAMAELRAQLKEIQAELREIREKVHALHEQRSAEKTGEKGSHKRPARRVSRSVANAR